MNNSIYQLPLHHLRSWLLNQGFALAYPLYRLLGPSRIKWHKSRQRLLRYPSTSLGFAVGQFLWKHQLELLPGFENHDVFHVLLGYEATAVSETALQWHLLGNGKRSPFCCLAAFSGAILFPEHGSHFRKAFQRGRAQRPFHQWRFEHLLQEPLADLQAFIHRQLSSAGGGGR